jgi:nuclear transport factor 2 (NTF2) superfamily protein
MITAMPCKQDAVVWMGFLGACRIHGNVEMGKQAAEQVLKLDHENAADYVLLSNIYAVLTTRISVRMSYSRERKEMCRDSHTWIEVNNEEHTFIVNDQNHPQMTETFTELEIVEILHDVPAMKFVLHDIQRKT